MNMLNFPSTKFQITISYKHPITSITWLVSFEKRHFPFIQNELPNWLAPLLYLACPDIWYSPSNHRLFLSGARYRHGRLPPILFAIRRSVFMEVLMRSILPHTLMQFVWRAFIYDAPHVTAWPLSLFIVWASVSFCFEHSTHFRAFFYF